MRENSPIIGIDLDNTIIDYNTAFHNLALDLRLISKNTAVAKQEIRNIIRCSSEGEQMWQQLQAQVYGPFIDRAVKFEGISAFIARCAQEKIRVFIISHKTQYSCSSEKSCDLRQAAITWLKNNKIVNSVNSGITQEDIYFEDTRLEKLTRIEKLGCTHFVDDLPELFQEKIFPKNVVKLLFGNINGEVGMKDVIPFSDWREINNYFFDSKTKVIFSN